MVLGFSLTAGPYFCGWICPTGTLQELVAIPRAALGLAALPDHIDFKWADNLQQTGEWSDFMLNGDAAPNDRFNYRARFKP